MKKKSPDIAPFQKDIVNFLQNPGKHSQEFEKKYINDTGIISFFKKLGQVLESKYYQKKDVEKFIDKANNLLLEYARHRYSKELSLTDDDNFDSLVTSLNFMGQELANSTVTTHYLNDVFNSIGDIVLVVNKVGHILYANSVGCQILGYQYRDLKDMPMEMILDNGIGINELLKNQSKQIDVNYINSSGEPLPVSLKISHFQRSDNPMMGYVIIARDMSEVLRYQKEIELKNKLITRANENLEEAHNSLKTILDSLDAFVYIEDDITQELLFVNEYGKKNIGVNPDQIGKNSPVGYENGVFSSFISQKSRNRNNSPGEVNKWECEDSTNGRWYDCRDKSITWSDGGTVRLVIATDITDRKHAEIELIKAKEKAEESDYMHRFLMENMADGVLYVTPDGTIIFANDAATRILNSPLNQLYGGSVFDKFFQALDKNGNPIDPEKHPVKVTLKTRQPVKDVEIYLLISDLENSKWIRINSMPRFSSDKKTINLVVLTFEDITQQKLAEKELKLKESLEKKVALAEESLKFKQKFLANMSHEIRTPLSGILGITEALGRTELSEQQIEFLRILKVSGESLRGIIDDVLDYSKIEAGKIQLRKSVFSIRESVKSAIDLFKNSTKKDIKLKYAVSNEVPEYLEADELRISQVIRNLLSNAIKFTETGSISVIVTLPDQKKPKPGGDLKIKVEVIDTGIGISESKQEELFKPFVQLSEEGQKKYDGTGLGLSICKEIVEMHGGRIGVISINNEGSTLWFTFKAKSSEKVRTGGKNKIRKKKVISQILNILLVEDNIINQKVISINLKYLGHHVTFANNGSDALEKIKNEKFDLILMDVQMPVMDGVATTQKLKEEYNDLPPIVGLSANAFEGDKEKYLNLGMDEYLTKPLKVEDFLDVIDKLFG